MKELIGAAAVVIGLAAYVPYFADIFRHRTHPHPYSWLSWGISGSLGFALLVTHDAGAGAWPLGMVTVICFIIAALAWRMDGAKSISKGDGYMLAASLVALILWLFADQPTLAMLLLVGADVFAMVPTVRKVWNRPYSETVSMWAITGFRHVLGVFALSSYTLLTLAGPATWIVGNTLLVLMILARRKVIRRPRPVLRRKRA